MRAFLVDEALAVRLMVEGFKASKDAKGDIPDGLRYAAEDDYEDPLPRQNDHG